jgi:hypothetical protein
MALEKLRTIIITSIPIALGNRTGDTGATEVIVVTDTYGMRTGLSRIGEWPALSASSRCSQA